MEVYFRCLKTCQRALQDAGEAAFVDANDFLVFHLGGSAKFVRHAFEQASDGCSRRGLD